MDSYGYAYSLTSEYYKVWSFDYFDEVMLGATIVAEPTDYFFETLYVPVVVPIEYEGKIQGELIGLLDLDVLSSYIGDAYISDGLFYLVDQSGNIIIQKNEGDYNENQEVFVKHSESGTMFDEEIELSDHHVMLKDIAGDVTLSIHNQTFYASYYQTHINDWYYITIVEKSDLIYQFIEGIQVQMLLIILALISLAYLIFHKSKTETVLYDKELEHTIYYDKLTGLANLMKFQNDIHNVLIENPTTDYVVTMIDIIDFKSINELHGFQVGDEALCLLAERFSALPTEQGIFGKGVKDEFWYFDTAEAMNETLSMSEHIERKIFLDNEVFKNVRLALRYGTYYIEDNEEAVLNIISNTQFAHAMAKKEEKRHTIFNVETKNKILYETNIANRQEAALMNREFLVFMQPKYQLNTEKIVGAEALVRWVQRDGEVLSPVKFLPIFEKNGFIKQIDMFMFEEVCKIIRNWIKMGITPTKISVNFSRLHLTSSQFVKTLIDIIERYEVPKKYIELELTETVASENEEQLVRVLEEVHKYNLTMAIDDFGSGYSSLGILRKMNFDVIKLDRSFLWDYENEDRSKSIIKNMIELSRDLDSTIVAEGVEREEDVEFLRGIDCDVAQGFYFAKPMIHHDFTELLQSRSPENIVEIED